MHEQDNSNQTSEHKHTNFKLCPAGVEVTRMVTSNGRVFSKLNSMSSDNTSCQAHYHLASMDCFINHGKGLDKTSGRDMGEKINIKADDTNAEFVPPLKDTRKSRLSKSRRVFNGLIILIFLVNFFHTLSKFNWPTKLYTSVTGRLSWNFPWVPSSSSSSTLSQFASFETTKSTFGGWETMNYFQALANVYFGSFPFFFSLNWNNLFGVKDIFVQFGQPLNITYDIIANVPTNESIAESLFYYTSGAHVGGRNFSQALWTKEKWIGYGIDNVHISIYEPFVTYPIDHSLKLLTRNNNGGDKGGSEWKVQFTATLKEDELIEDPTTCDPNGIPAFNAYSANGNVTASYVYVNYGSFYDFESLVRASVPLEGKIAIARYGKISRGIKMRRAQQLGMVGMLLYSDPGDDNGITVENGYEAYPNGPARQASSIQRGSVAYFSLLYGDPTTPGYAAKPGVDRQSPDEFLPSIPSLPVSYREIIPFLKALNGVGMKGEEFGETWKTGGLSSYGINYNVGPSPESVQINLYSEQKRSYTSMWNVIGIINGTLGDEVVIVGGHRDAWIVGGALDPNGGSAVIDVMVKSFGAAYKAGWRPLRTIVFASWDGEEYSLLGSSEWVEEHVPWLKDAAVSYFNLDGAASGPVYFVEGSGMLSRVVREITTTVNLPGDNTNGTGGVKVFEDWNGECELMGGGSDFVPFLDLVGVSSVSMVFRANETVYHYHSNYDSYTWMQKFGDPGLHYHVTLARLMNAVVLRMSNSLILPFGITGYIKGMGKKLEELLKPFEMMPKAEIWLNSTQTMSMGGGEDEMFEGAGIFSKDGPTHKLFPQLLREVVELHTDGVEFEERVERFRQSFEPANLPKKWEIWKFISMFVKVRKLNNVYRSFERDHFIREEGLPGRRTFKHTLIAPSLWNGYSADAFPGLVYGLQQLRRARSASDALAERIRGNHTGGEPEDEYKPDGETREVWPGKFLRQWESIYIEQFKKARKTLNTVKL